MADVQTEHGFVMIALNLFAALCRADWTVGEWAVLCEVLSQVYGPQKRRSVHVNVRDLEHYSGISDKNLYRALRDLKRCGVLRGHKDGSVGFDKDFESWLAARPDPGSAPRLGPGAMRQALSANGRFGLAAPIKKSKPVGVYPDTGGVYPDTESAPERCLDRHRKCTPTVSIQTPPIIEEARASEDPEIQDGKKASPYGAAAGAGVGRIVGLDEVTDAARECFPDFAAGLPALAHDIGRTLGGRFDCYAAALGAARQRIDSGRAIDDLHAWCLKVAARYRETGIPASGPIRVAGAAAPVARAESPHERRRREMQEGFARMKARNQEASTRDRE